MSTLISCPECSGKLRLSETLLGKKVRCPTCKNIFIAEDSADAVEDIAEVAELVEKPVRRKPTRIRADEEEDDRRRQRRRPVDDDEDEDDEDRPRRRRRAEEDDDDDDDRRETPATKMEKAKKQLAWAQLAAHLIFIYAIVALSSIGMLLLLTFVGLLGVFIPDWVTLLLVGLPGLGGVITGVTGMVFTILGPAQRAAFGLAIAATATGALHLLLLFASMLHTVQVHQRNRFMGLATALGIFASGWGDQASAMLTFGNIGPFLDPLSLFVALSEVASLIVTSLCLRAIVLNFPGREDPSRQAIVQVILTGSAAVLLIIMGLIMRAIATSLAASSTGVRVITWVSVLGNFGILITVYVFFLLFTMKVKAYLQTQKIR